MHQSDTGLSRSVPDAGRRSIWNSHAARRACRLGSLTMIPERFVDGCPAVGVRTQDVRIRAVTVMMAEINHFDHVTIVNH